MKFDLPRRDHPNLEKYEKERKLPPEMALVRDNIKKLQRDMVNFLDSEKISRGDILYSHNQTVDFTAFLREKVSFFSPIVHGKGLSFAFDLEDSCRIQADPFPLDRICNNLLMNAVKFTDTGSISIKLAKKGKRLICRVADTGRGVPFIFLTALSGEDVRIRNREERGSLYLSVFNLSLAVFVYYNSLWMRRVLFYYPGRLAPLLEGLPLLITQRFVRTQQNSELLSNSSGPDSAVQFHDPGQRAYYRNENCRLHEGWHSRNISGEIR